MSHRLECGMAVSGLRMAVVVQVGSPSPSPSLECGMAVSGLTMAVVVQVGSPSPSLE